MNKTALLLILALTVALFSACGAPADNGGTEVKGPDSAETGNEPPTIDENGDPVSDATEIVLEENLPYKNVLPEEAKNIIDDNENLVIIDVSSAYNQGHIPGAVNIPLAELEQKIPELEKNKDYFVYCNFDSSAAIAGAEKLADAGFKTIYRLEGNLGGWVAAGFDTER